MRLKRGEWRRAPLNQTVQDRRSDRLNGGCSVTGCDHCPVVLLDGDLFCGTHGVEAGWAR